jgi:hypothetical protein
VASRLARLAEAEGEKRRSPEGGIELGDAYGVSSQGIVDHLHKRFARTGLR